MEQMSCTARFIRPFVRLLNQHPDSASFKLDRLEAIGVEQRVRLEIAHDTVLRWVAKTGDPDLGLKAGRRMCVGSGGVLEFAMHSARSLRDSVSVANRYRRLFSDALEPTLKVEGGSALLRLENKLSWPRAIADFTMSAWYHTHVRVQLPDAPELECLFAHPEPPDLTEYRESFGNVKLTFDAPHYGFRFPAELAETPLAGADPLLHAMHCELLESLHAALPEPQNVAMRVRELLAGELRRGRPTAVGVARRLHMSRRTMVRRLENEGTSFTEQLDELRHQLALRFVATPKLPLNEITDLLGFSHVQGFHRAFKRWTGQTPIQFRNASIRGAWRSPNLDATPSLDEAPSAEAHLAAPPPSASEGPRH